MKKAIYKIVNIVNGKIYVGQSVNPKKRFVSHCSRSKNKSDNSPIHSAIRKYGKENFKLEIIEWAEDYNNREKYWIQKLNSKVPFGYNITDGGEDPPHKYGEEHPNSIITDEQVDKIIKLLKDSDLTEPEIGRSFFPPFNQVLINSINHGITHRRDGERYPIRTNCPYNLTEEQVGDIKWLLKNTLYPCSQIADYYYVDTSTIKHINTGRNYRDEVDSYPLRKTRGKKQLEPVETILAKRSTDDIDTHLEMGVCAK